MGEIERIFQKKKEKKKETDVGKKNLEDISRQKETISQGKAIVVGERNERISQGKERPRIYLLHLIEVR